MRFVASPAFNRKFKKLHPRQRRILEQALAEILADPIQGVAKVKSLEAVQVYKFTIDKTQYLLAYTVVSDWEIQLHQFGAHENFYRYLKKKK